MISLSTYCSEPVPDTPEAPVTWGLGEKLWSRHGEMDLQLFQGKAVVQRALTAWHIQGPNH